MPQMMTAKYLLNSRMLAASLALLPNLKLDAAPFIAPASTLPLIESVASPTRDLRAYVLAVVQRSLAPELEAQSLGIARAVIEEGNRQKLDPFFILAVIKTESQFQPDVIGSHGEIGLMQILPQTAKWLAPRLGMGDVVDLHDPATNIRLGSAYFAQLRRMFKGRPGRFVGAYNMGVGNVRRLVAARTEPHLYSDKVLGNYRDFYTNVVHRFD